MKYAVVTGSTKGIGKAIAEKLIDEGWFVFVNYAHDIVSAEKFEKEHSVNPGEKQFELIQEDLSNYAAVQHLIEQILKRTDRIDCLVLNAAETDRTPFGEIQAECWEHVLQTNLNAPFFLVQGLRDHIRENGGRIIFIGSICGIYPHAISPAYGVSKAAVHQLAKELVKFFAPKGITVNAVIPSFVDTPWQKSKTENHRKRIEDKLALHRFAQPEEVAQLCWEVINNSYINGANLRIDGGYSYR